MTRQKDSRRAWAPGLPSCTLHWVAGVGAGQLRELRQQAGCDGWGVSHSQDGSLYSLRRLTSEAALAEEHRRVAALVAQLAPAGWQLRSFYYQAGQLLWQQHSQAAQEECIGSAVGSPFGAGCRERVLSQG